MNSNLPEIKKNEMNLNKSKANKLQKAKEGYHQSKPPYGFSMNTKTHIIYPNQDYGRVKRIYQNCKNRKAKDKGNISKFAKAYHISRHTIYRILNDNENLVYQGFVVYQGKKYQGLHTAIL